MDERAAYDARLDLMNLNESWKVLVSWLPAEGEVSQIDAATLVAEQWERSKYAYKGLGRVANEAPVGDYVGVETEVMPETEGE